MRKPVARMVEALGAYTNVLRLLPSFIIVGGQRCGTNSLYEYLVRHPCIARALPGQEVHFFDIKYDKGPGWYRGHFPSVAKSFLVRLKHHYRLVTGECSPYYMFHPHAPRRIADMLPDVKIIAILRNPVERAYSHYQHERSRGVEQLSFEEALDREPQRLDGEVEKMLQDPTYYSYPHHHFSYLSRGVYIDQIETLFSLFPPENILVMFSEQLFAEPAAAHAEALEFLGYAPRALTAYNRHNPGRYEGMPAALRTRLADHFGEPNERLYRFLETHFRWE